MTILFLGFAEFSDKNSILIPQLDEYSHYLQYLDFVSYVDKAIILDFFSRILFWKQK